MLYIITYKDMQPNSRLMLLRVEQNDTAAEITMRLALNFLVSILASACFPAFAQTPEAKPCEGITDLPLRAAVSAASSFVGRNWVERGPDWFVAYDQRPLHGTHSLAATKNRAERQSTAMCGPVMSRAR